MKKKRMIIALTCTLCASLIIMLTLYSNEAPLQTKTSKTNTEKLNEPAPKAKDPVKVEEETKPTVIPENNTTYTSSLQSEIENYLVTQNVDSSLIAVHVKDLTNGEEVQINIDQIFTAASTYKLPLAMYYYEKINAGELSPNTPYQFLDIHYQEGGVIPYTYEIGSYIPLSNILEWVITVSDNTAGHMLFEYLGGWVNFRYQIDKYATYPLFNEFYGSENLTTAHYLSDVLFYLYTHQSEYTTLINDLYQAQPNNYLNLKTPSLTAQKYGWLGYNRHSCGLVFGEHPYSIVVLTALGNQGEYLMGDINAICYQYFYGNN